MKKGSITVYLCLVLAGMLTLILTAMFSVRHAAGRAVLASAAEQGMYSLFSRFDRELFDEYGILALDGGYGGSELKLGSLQKEAEEVSDFLLGVSGDLTGPSNLMNFSEEKGEVTGYVLLTDQDGMFLREQAAKALLGKKTAAAVQHVRGQLKEYVPEWNRLELNGKSIDVEGTEEKYRDLKESGAEGTETSIQADAFSGSVQGILCDQTTEETAAPPSVSAAQTENPIETIQTMRKTGIMNLVLPRDRTLSAGTIAGNRASRRTLQKGMGIAAGGEASAADRVVLAEYLMDTFDDFTEAGNGESAGLQYQVEYAIGGKDSDKENLKAVLNQLLAVREISNYLYLLKDPVKQEEVHTAALSICTLVGLPVGEPVVAEMLRFCWAYGESILDLRELMKGGKIPLIKDAASWQLSLAMLTHLQDEVTEQHGSGNGMSYQWYLRMLLMKKNEKSLTGSLMDLLEHRMQQLPGREGFRIDNCLVSMTVCFRARQEQMFLMEAERSYDYIQ